MIALVPSFENPARESSDCLIGTGIATLIAGLGAAGASVANQKSQSKANREATTTESKYTDLALSDTRGERQRQQAIDDDARLYDRDQAAQQLLYRSGRDSIADARFADEQGYQRGEFANYKARLTPFQNAGNAATSRLSAVAGRALPASVPMAGNGGMVSLKAPDGTVRQVPAEQADHYLQLGAVRV